MIDQDLSLKILNNLLDIQLDSQQGGDPNQIQEVLNELTSKANNYALTLCSENVTYIAPSAPTSITLEKEYVGTYEDLVESTVKQDANQLLLSKVSQASISSALTYPTCTLNFSNWNPKGPNGFAPYGAIGLSKSDINKLANDLLQIEIVKHKYESTVNTYLTGAMSIEKQIADISGRLKKNVLSKYPMYANSYLVEENSYRSEGGKEVGDPVMVEVTLNVKTYKSKTTRLTALASFKYRETAYSSQVKSGMLYAEAQVTDYTSSTEKVKVSLPAWYYAQQISTTAYYPQKAYIGLFTDYDFMNDTEKNETGMPNKDGTRFREPPHKASNNENFTYQRMSLHEGLFSGDYVFNNILQAGASQVENKENSLELLGKAYLNNKEIIMFPEILNEGSGVTQGWGNIYGFGVFENELPTEGEKPFFWGPVVGAPIATKKGEVPLFRPNQFEVFLG